jgi:DNA-binding MarR family transcriptional regulator
MVGDRDDALPEYFWGVARRLRQLSRETLAPWEISPSHSRALGVLMRHGAMRLSDLSDHLRIAPRSATEVVDVLEERGLVERQPDPGDRRATMVALTENGKQVGEAIRSARTSEAERFFGELSETDRAHLARILRKLNA